MNQSISTLVHNVLEACWRRRRLLVGTMALIMTVGLIYAKLSPRTYVAKALLLLQESNRGSPLSPNTATGGRMQERLDGLQALLKSERVLSAVMSDIADEATIADPKKAAAWMKGFSLSLSLDLVGSDFLELRLRRDTPVDLGAHVNVVIFRFFEALLSSSDALNAIQVVLDTLKFKLDQAETIYARHKEDHQRNKPRDMDLEIKRLQAMQAELDAKESELEPLGQLKDTLELQAAAQAFISPQRSEVEVDRSSRSDPADAKQGPDAEHLVVLRETVARHSALAANVSLLRRGVEGVRASLREAVHTDHRQKALQAQVVKARETYQEYARRFIVPTGSRTTGLLGAPERIKLIDPPRDPDGPERSALKILLLSILASLLSGAGLVVLAEMLDTTVRRSRDIAELTGVPILARLPAA